MSIQTQIDRLTWAKTDIAAAIADKGVTVPDGTLLDGMAALIASIQVPDDEIFSVQTTLQSNEQSITFSGIEKAPIDWTLFLSSYENEGTTGVSRYILHASLEMNSALAFRITSTKFTMQVAPITTSYANSVFSITCSQIYHYFLSGFAYTLCYKI